MKGIKELEIFKKGNLLSKEEVQKSFDLYIDYLKNSDEGNFSKEKLSKILELCEKFKIKLDKCMLPRLIDDWWFYEYTLTTDGIELNLMYCQEIEIENGGNYSMTSTQHSTMLSVKCDYFKVEEYANYYGVTTTTVRQWIRRGKLRSAKKNGRDWIIPSIADKPKRGFESVSYNWEQLPEKILSEFPILKNYESIYIFQDEEDKSRFNCILGCLTSDNRFRVSITNQEREKLELALISLDEVTVEETNAMFLPDKES
ncbi:MAG: helix-turn-helix domain-containing protein [Clostridiales bacterium]|nr:helix-turn-helix domain-containing protein [Clostridiales bacterium]